MKQFWLIFVVFCFLSAQKTVAIIDFEGIGISRDEALALSRKFGSEFQNLSDAKYTLIEREQIGEILKEQGFQMSGCVSSECIVEVGKFLGAELIVTGSISKVGDIYSIVARLLSVETTEIIKSVSFEHAGDIGLLLTSGMKKTARDLLKDPKSNVNSKDDLDYKREIIDSIINQYANKKEKNKRFWYSPNIPEKKLKNAKAIYLSDTLKPENVKFLYDDTASNNGSFGIALTYDGLHAMTSCIQCIEPPNDKSRNPIFFIPFENITSVDFVKNEYTEITLIINKKAFASLDYGLTIETQKAVINILNGISKELKD